MSLKDVESIESVAEFYAGQDVLVTGATGFMGKAIVEKLLYSCPKVARIFLLLRPKKGVPVEQRLATLQKDEVFDRVRRKNAQLLDKMVPIEGDVRELGLMLSAHSLERIKDVSVLIHGAATVRFDEPLKESLLMNTRGTREVLSLAKGLTKLKLFAHISTAYSNPHLNLCEEKLYPIDTDWREAIRMAETLDLEQLEACARKVIAYHPNTYTFTKQLSEHMVNDHRHELPIIIHRPSIVSPSVNEPSQGWVDNYNGPVGLMLPISVGISRILLGDKNCRLNFVPVDYVCNSLISVIAQAAPYLEKRRLAGQPLAEVPIYNYGIPKEKGVAISQVMSTGMKYAVIYPVENVLWYPQVCLTKSLLLYKLFFYLVQLLPGILIEGVLRATGQKLSILRLLRKIYYVQVSLLYFMSRQFNFTNMNTMNSQKLLSKGDTFIFKCESDVYFDTYMATSLLGARKHLLRQDPKTIPRSRIVFRIYQAVYYIVVGLLGYFALSSYLSKPTRI